VKKKMTGFLATAVTATVLLSCAEGEVNITGLTPSKAIDELSDSTFFKDVECITHDGKNVYASDTYNSRILKFDTDMNYVGSIGSHGEGPKEIHCLGGTASRNDTLYAITCDGLKTYTAEGDFVRFDKSDNSHANTYILYMDESECIYLSSMLDTFPLIKYDKHMNRCFGFGKRISDGVERKMGDTYLLQSFNGEILSVKMDEPVLVLYSRQGEQLMQRRMDHGVFKSRLLFKKQEQENDPGNNRKIYRLFNSMACSKNRIYLLYIHHDVQSPAPCCNRIAEFTFENSDFRLTNVYQLQDRWYSSFCCVDNRFICYSVVKQEFQMYEL
jgi:hypothetical protein